MKKITLVFISLFLLASPLFAQENCANEKRKEFDALFEELKEVDKEAAMEAKHALGVVSGFEEFDDKEPRCSHMDKLLKQMRNYIDLYK